MVEKISVQIALEGGKEVEQQLADIGEAGQKAFADITKSAEQVGGFKNLKPEDVSKKLEDLGLKGTEAFEKIQGAVKTAGRWESVVQGVAALETGFMAVAKAAGVVGAAVVAAGVALSRFTSEAAKVSEALHPLQELSGQSAENISALQIVFAQGGTSAQKFAATFTDITAKVQEASRTMADDIEQSSLRVEAAHQHAAQAALSVSNATLGLQAAQLRLAQLQSGVVNPAAQRALALAQASQAVAEAAQKVQQAFLAQKQAEHAARVAEANDLQQIIVLYQQMAAGVQVTFNPLTTVATKTRALEIALAQAAFRGQDMQEVLADIIKNADPLTRIDIKKAFQIDDKTMETLKRGGDTIRANRAAVQALGLELSAVDQANLQAFTSSWEKLGATMFAALEKAGAFLAPLGTLLAEGLQVALEAVIREVGNFTSGVQKIGEEFNTIATAGAAAIAFLVNAINSGTEAVTGFLNAITSISWDTIANLGVQAWDAITAAIQGAIDKVLEFLGFKSAAAAPVGGEGDTGLPFAGGGVIGGRGTGTSDSNLAWVSRGEHIMPARAVRQPGVLAFLEALRRSGGDLSRVLDGMGRFALGGVVPQMQLRPAFANGGLVEGRRVLNLNIEGQSFAGLSVPESTAQALERFAVHSQIASTGRKPSWRR
jgi:hypothetical protein